ncbi:MAG: TMEM165/GDT1 family protein [Firmicutes bacterium]|nr:TMEM165/GDT1 family protein [Bacillota bacterium]
MDWKVFSLTFGMLFLAELGDKTQLAVVTMACKTKAPWSVFLGGSAAMVLVTLLGSFVGGYVTSYVPVKYLSIAAGLLFLAFGVMILYQSLNSTD